jgi:hypothetical protein
MYGRCALSALFNHNQPEIYTTLLDRIPNSLCPRADVSGAESGTSTRHSGQRMTWIQIVVVGNVWDRLTSQRSDEVQGHSMALIDNRNENCGGRDLASALLPPGY